MQTPKPPKPQNPLDVKTFLYFPGRFLEIMALGLSISFVLCGCSNSREGSSTSTGHFALNPEKAEEVGAFGTQIKFAHEIVMDKEACGSIE